MIRKRQCQVGRGFKQDGKPRAEALGREKVKLGQLRMVREEWSEGSPQPLVRPWGEACSATPPGPAWASRG